MAASPEALSETLPGGDATTALIVAVRAAMLQCLRGQAFSGPLLDGPHALMDYLQIDMAHAPVETARLLFLDAENRLVSDEVMWTGTIDRVPFYIREIVVRALALRAAGLILVHNHPSGDASPSIADIAVTRSLAETGRTLGIVVHDHIIVARSGARSLAREGLFS